MLRLLHAADVHLGARLGAFGGLAEERRREVLEAWARLPEVAERTGAGAVLVAGDLFDGPRPEDGVLAVVQETARRLRRAGVPIFAVPGNHDAPSLEPGLYGRALPEATVFEQPVFGPPATVEVGDVPLHVYGLAFDPAEEPDPLSTFRRAELPGVHVVLLHGSVPDAPHWEGGRSLPLPPERLADLPVDYVALGDYHRFRPPDEFDGAPACYAGSFAAVDLTETGRRGPVLVELEAGSAPRVELLDSGVAPVVRPEPLDVTRFPDEEAVAEAAADPVPADAVPVVRLSGEPGFPLDAEAVRRRLEARFGFASVEDETRFFASDRLTELARRNTVAGHVARLGLRRVEAAEGGEERAVAERGLRIALRLLEVQ